MGLPEVFVVDGVKCGVAAAAADAGSEIAENTAREEDCGWVLLDSGDKGTAHIEAGSQEFDVGDDVGGVAHGTGHGEHCSHWR